VQLHNLYMTSFADQKNLKYELYKHMYLGAPQIRCNLFLKITSVKWGTLTNI